jgi:hypothetical protein
VTLRLALRLLLCVFAALLFSGCALTEPGPSTSQVVEHGKQPKAAPKFGSARVPEPTRGQYVTSFSSVGRWIYCVRDPELPLRLTGADEWEYYPSVEAAQRRRPGYRLFRQCQLDWPDPKPADKHP